MRPRIWRPFSDTNRARMEPPSLTREPRGPFCMAAVEDISVSIASGGGTRAGYESQAVSVGRPSPAAQTRQAASLPIFSFSLVLQFGATAPRMRKCSPVLRRRMMKRVAVLALAVCMTISGFAEKGFAQKATKASAGGGTIDKAYLQKIW